MIGGYFHQGSGLGNMLFRYITVRSLALDKGYDFCMTYTPDGSGKTPGFKGDSFMDIQWKAPRPSSLDGFTSFEEKKVVVDGLDVRSYDPEINFVKDNTIIDGEFQSDKYWGHHLDFINQWLKVEPLEVPDDTCVIGFRGGEYQVVSDLFLPNEYWEKSIAMMREINPKMKFEVHTDDINTASKFFGYMGVKIIHDIGWNWRAMRYARHAIVANSSFYIIPRLLRHNDGDGVLTIAPKYWARYNTKQWALPQNYYQQFEYIHHEGGSDKL